MRKRDFPLSNKRLLSLHPNPQLCTSRSVQVIAIANDITYSSGSFGPREDAAFRAALEHALAERLPVVYLAANSGARVGLANEVKQCLQACPVSWIVDSGKTVCCPSRRLRRSDRI